MFCREKSQRSILGLAARFDISFVIVFLNAAGLVQESAGTCENNME